MGSVVADIRQTIDNTDLPSGYRSILVVSLVNNERKNGYLLSCLSRLFLSHCCSTLPSAPWVKQC